MIASQFGQNQSSNARSFDAIAFEEQHEADFLKVIAPEKFNNTYADGCWDAYLLNEPEAYQWHSPDYKKGYLKGIEEKFDTKFAA